MKPINTAAQDKMAHWAAASGNQNGYIEEMEAQGQQQFVNSDVMPSKAPWDELAVLGFVKGDSVEGDELFVNCTLPAGWKRVGSDHNMWSRIEDERGVERVAVFYKAAFYDRRADARIINPGRDTAGAAYYDQKAELPAKWDVFTDSEKAEFWAAIEGFRADLRKYPDAKYQATVDGLLALRV